MWDVKRELRHMRLFYLSKVNTVSSQLNKDLIYQQFIEQKLGLNRRYLLSLYNQIVEENYEKRNF